MVNLAHCMAHAVSAFAHCLMLVGVVSVVLFGMHACGYRWGIVCVCCVCIII